MATLALKQIREAAAGVPHIGERAVNTESEYDYGSRSGVWRLLRLFNKHNIEYTLYAVSRALKDNPAVRISSVKNGDDIASHTYRWIDYHSYHLQQQKEYIRKEIDVITKICGVLPKGWYYGRLSPRSQALVWDVHKELDIPLLWKSGSYDDIP
jgi:peptidoglycan/xylan/chitin deacetylase (PgdA/CDA1 family)